MHYLTTADYYLTAGLACWLWVALDLITPAVRHPLPLSGDQDMPNFKQDIEAEAGDEPIEAIVIGEMGWGDFGSDEVPGYAEQPKNRVLAWEEASPLLDYEYDRGLGAPECQAITVWTATRVLFVSQYDGATGVEAIPRNPVDHRPIMPGG